VRLLILGTEQPSECCSRSSKCRLQAGCLRLNRRPLRCQRCTEQECSGLGPNDSLALLPGCLEDLVRQLQHHNYVLDLQYHY